MPKVTVGSIVKTSIVTAFTIAAALIWKDVITETIELFVPSGEILFFKILAAILSTILVIIAIFIILKTESKTEIVIKKLRHRKSNKK